MNKKIIGLATTVGLFCLTSLVSAQITNPLGSSSFGDLLGKIATAVGGLIAGLGTIGFVVAGILFLTSGGSPDKTAAAKKALAYAAAGIAIGLAASGIVSAVKTIIGVK